MFPIHPFVPPLFAPSTNPVFGVTVLAVIVLFAVPLKNDEQTPVVRLSMIQHIAFELKKRVLTVKNRLSVPL